MSTDSDYVNHGNTGLFWFSEIFSDIRIYLAVQLLSLMFETQTQSCVSISNCTVHLNHDATCFSRIPAGKSQSWY